MIERRVRFALDVTIRATTEEDYDSKFRDLKAELRAFKPINGREPDAFVLQTVSELITND